MKKTMYMPSKALARSLALLMVIQLTAGAVWTPAYAAEQQNITNQSLPIPDATPGLVERMMRKAHLRRAPKAVAGTTAAKPAAKPAAAPLERIDAKSAAATLQTSDSASTETTAPGWAAEITETPSNSAIDATAATPKAPAPVASTPAPVETSPVATTAAPTATPTDLPLRGLDTAPTATTPVSPVTETATTTPSAPVTETATTTPAAPAVETVAATPVTTPAADAAVFSAPKDLTSSLTAPKKDAIDNDPVFSIPTTALAPLPVPGITPEGTPEVTLDGCIVIDNDEIVEQAATIAYEDLPTDEGGTKIMAGARFPVVITSEINSKTAKKGDTIHGRLKYDLKIKDRLVAKKGSVVLGHIDYALRARTVMGSLISTERFYRNSGCLGVKFDEIINERGEHIPLVAEPAKQALYVKNKAEGRVLGINHKGQITGPWSQQLRYKAIRVGLNFALAPAGVFSFGAAPVALGVMGAVNPSFAFMKPVGLNVRHRRLKGFAWGFLSGIPGSWLIEDTTVKGQEAVIKPGDEFLAQFRQEFTGEPASEADLMPGAATKVRGEVVGGMPEKTDKKSKKK